MHNLYAYEFFRGSFYYYLFLSHHMNQKLRSLYVFLNNGQSLPQVNYITRTV